MGIPQVIEPPVSPLLGRPAVSHGESARYSQAARRAIACGDVAGFMSLVGAPYEAVLIPLTAPSARWRARLVAPDAGPPPGGTYLARIVGDHVWPPVEVDLDDTGRYCSVLHLGEYSRDAAGDLGPGPLRLQFLIRNVLNT